MHMSKQRHGENVKHFLLGAGLALALVVVAPAMAQVGGFTSPTSGTSGGTAPSLSTVSSPTNTTVAPTAPTGGTAPTVGTQPAPTGGTTGGTQPAPTGVTTGGTTGGTQPTGGTTGVPPTGGTGTAGSTVSQQPLQQSGTGTGAFYCFALSRQATKEECDTADAAKGTGTKPTQTQTGTSGSGAMMKEGIMKEGMEGASKESSRSRFGKPSTPATDLEEGEKPGFGFGRGGGLGQGGMGKGRGFEKKEGMESMEGEAMEETGKKGRRDSMFGEESESGMGKKRGSSQSQGGLFSTDQFQDFGSQFGFEKQFSSKKKTKLEVPEVDTSDTEGEQLDALGDAVKQISKIKSKKKAKDNAIAVAIQLEQFCESEELECEDALATLSKILKRKSSSRTQISGTLKDVFKEIREIYESGGEEVEEGSLFEDVETEE